MTPPARWHFEAANVPIRLREAGDDLNGLLVSHGASERARFAARLVTEEIVLNAFQHGGATTVTLDVDPADDPCRLVFEDDGAPFDPTTRPIRSESDDPGDVSSGGRGLVFLHGFAKAIEYRPVDGGNRLYVCLAD